MSKIAVMTDSNSGITQDLGKKLGITVVPMPFFIDGEEYLEDITLNQEQFYEMLLADKEVSTSQPSVGFVTSKWDELLEEYDSIIYIPMSSGLSKSCEVAAQAAMQDEYKGKVFVINNQRISITQRRSVMDALEMIERGYSAEKIAQVLIDVKMESDIYIMVDTLKYLKKGGRITPAAAALGGFLKLKPILLIKGEKLDSFKMRNRTVENAMDIMIDSARKNIEGYMKDKDGRTDNVHIDVAYSGTDRQYAEQFADRIAREFNVDKANIYVDPLSLSVSCHIGNGALAIAVTKYIPSKA